VNEVFIGNTKEDSKEPLPPVADVLERIPPAPPPPDCSAGVLDPPPPATTRKSTTIPAEGVMLLLAALAKDVPFALVAVTVKV
jgi:hypothetical protein